MHLTLPVNILCRGNLEAGAQLFDRHPETRFILDHLGILQPHEPAARAAEPWADLPKVLELAKRPNLVIKVSGACAKAYGWKPAVAKWIAVQLRTGQKSPRSRAFLFVNTCSRNRAGLPFSSLAAGWPHDVWALRHLHEPFSWTSILLSLLTSSVPSSMTR